MDTSYTEAHQNSKRLFGVLVGFCSIVHTVAS